MKRLLQEFGFRKSTYERPNQRWACGHACPGGACPAGPDSSGRCRATAECNPLRKGDRWHCTRSQAQGGPCPDGPMPDGSCGRPIPKCVPTRSLLMWRGFTVRIVLGLSLATLLITFGSGLGNRLLSPGELTFAHASAESKCSDCHEGVRGAPAEWLTRRTPHGEGRLCLNCHNVGSQPFLPHALPAEKLTQLTEAILQHGHPTKNPAHLQLASLARRQPDGALACASCHQEHHGNDHDLRKLADDQCQSCHAVQFADFAGGHPSFSATYPFGRRTRIIFDHQSHLEHHFKAPGSSGPSNCQSCHTVDVRGSSMMLKPFAESCATCHEPQVRGKGAVNTGIPVIALPRFDADKLIGNYGIGEWPEDADRPLTPFMQLLLSADPGVSNALKTLREIDLSNLPKDSTETLRAAQTLAWGIKSLLFDVSIKGHSELARRLSAALNRPLSDLEKEKLISMLNLSELKSGLFPGFPHLQEEIGKLRKDGEFADTELISSPPLPAKSAFKPVPADDWVSYGGWYSPEASFALFYRPQGHSDPFLSGWINLATSAKLSGLFDQLTDPKSPGLCTKCHSVDGTLDTQQVNWTGNRPNQEAHGFEKFMHASHLSLIGAKGCQTCHELSPGNPEKNYATAFANGSRDPLKFQSNFKGINKETCAACHRPDFASNSCTHCHNYHIGNFSRLVLEKKAIPGRPAADRP